MAWFPGVIPNVKFGFNLDIDNGERNTCWPRAGAANQYVIPSGAEVLDVISADAQDDVSGTGAQQVTISGLDANYNQISEVVSLTGNGTAQTTNAFLAVNRAKTTRGGSGGKNVADIKHSANYFQSLPGGDTCR